MAAQEIEQLIKLLSKMPALGPRSARRIVLYLLGHKETVFAPLIADMQTVMQQVKECPVCGNMDTCAPCSVCQNNTRDKTQICIVQDVADLWAMERAQVFKGVYYVLGGLLSAIDGIGPQELRLNTLLERIRTDGVQEVVLALPSTVEGQTTSFYIKDLLASASVKISALSKGIPLGGELDYLDDGTLQMAFVARN